MDKWLASSKDLKIGLTKKEAEITRFTTGSTILDLVVSGVKGQFGLQSGKFFNLVGDKASGKTQLAMQIIAEAIQKYGERVKYCIDDAESGNAFDTESMFGFSVIGHTVQSDTVEKAFYNITKFCETVDDTDCGIYILDSLDALTAKEDDDRADERIKAFDNGKEFDKGSYGMNKQKFLSNTFFPQLAGMVEQKNVLVIIISQVRENVDMFSFEKYKRSGGKALDFYANVILWLNTQKKITLKERTVGSIVKAKITKLKAPRPFRECVYTLLFDYGIDEIGSNLDYAYDLLTPTGEYKSKKEVIDWNGQSLTRVQMIKYIEDNDLQDKLRQEVIDKWEAIEQSIESKRKNRYGTHPIICDDVPEIAVDETDEADAALAEAKETRRGRPAKLN